MELIDDWEPKSIETCSQCFNCLQSSQLLIEDYERSFKPEPVLPLNQPVGCLIFL